MLSTAITVGFLSHFALSSDLEDDRSPSLVIPSKMKSDHIEPRNKWKITRHRPKRKLSHSGDEGWEDPKESEDCNEKWPRMKPMLARQRNPYDPTNQPEYSDSAKIVGTIPFSDTLLQSTDSTPAGSDWIRIRCSHFFEFQNTKTGEVYQLASLEDALLIDDETAVGIKTGSIIQYKHGEEGFIPVKQKNNFQGTGLTKELKWYRVDQSDGSDGYSAYGFWINEFEHKAHVIDLRTLQLKRTVGLPKGVHSWDSGSPVILTQCGRDVFVTNLHSRRIVDRFVLNSVFIVGYSMKISPDQKTVIFDTGTKDDIRQGVYLLRIGESRVIALPNTQGCTYMKWLHSQLFTLTIRESSQDRYSLVYHVNDLDNPKVIRIKRLETLDDFRMGSIVTASDLLSHQFNNRFVPGDRFVIGNTLVRVEWIEKEMTNESNTFGTDDDSEALSMISHDTHYDVSGYRSPIPVESKSRTNNVKRRRRANQTIEDLLRQVSEGKPIHVRKSKSRNYQFKTEEYAIKMRIDKDGLLLNHTDLETEMESEQRIKLDLSIPSNWSIIQGNPDTIMVWQKHDSDGRTKTLVNVVDGSVQSWTEQWSKDTRDFLNRMFGPNADESVAWVERDEDEDGSEYTGMVLTNGD